MSTNNTNSPSNTGDDCSICLNLLGIGASLLTLSCGHKFHLDCLVSNVKAQNKQCPLCRTQIDAGLVNMLASANPIPASTNINQPAASIIPSVEEPVDEGSVNDLLTRITSARQAVSVLYAADDIPLITATTTLEYEAQPSHQQSNIFGLVTLKAPPCILPPDGDILSTSRVPIDLVCVVDQSGSMGGEKITLLKQTLIYIVEQLNELDRLAIVSFDTTAFDRSHGLKRMNQQNQNILKQAIQNDIVDRGGTYIGSGLQMGIQLLLNRQTKNPLSGLLLLTDGQDNQTRDYSQLMQTLPDNTQCHTFGYGPDHTPSLLVQLAEQGHEGTFTYVDEERAVGPAFAMALAGLFTCVAQKIQVNIQFNGDYKVTAFHSKYKYEPTQLPSSQITVHLNNLNAEENRNLVFQVQVPKIEDEQNVEMDSLQSMSQNQSDNSQPTAIPNNIIGNVSITYIEPNSNRTLTVNSVPFNLIRSPNPSSDLLQTNYTLDIQRNRVETANALKLAMDEYDYGRSMALLKAQVEKIRASVSAQDEFCQNLIRDLQHHYPTEQSYRSSNSNAYMQHRTERGTYFPSTTTSTQQYQSSRQVQQAVHYTSSHN